MSNSGNQNEFKSNEHSVTFTFYNSFFFIFSNVFEWFVAAMTALVTDWKLKFFF